MADAMVTAWLPPLLACDWTGAGHDVAIERAHAIFQRDFGDAATRPTFQQRILRLKRYPEVQGKSATFWHWVTEGPDEATRVLVASRVERIAWPRAMITETDRIPPRVRVWSNTRGRATRWLIATEDFGYVVVLDDRGEF